MTRHAADGRRPSATGWSAIEAPDQVIDR
jgi:hypothetical protein